MARDAYIADQLVESIETIQEIFDIPTFREASEKYDELSRKSTVGEIIENHEEGDDVEKTAIEKKEEELENRRDEMIENLP